MNSFIPRKTCLLTCPIVSGERKEDSGVIKFVKVECVWGIESPPVEQWGARTFSPTVPKIKPASLLHKQRIAERNTLWRLPRREIAHLKRSPSCLDASSSWIIEAQITYLHRGEAHRACSSDGEERWGLNPLPSFVFPRKHAEGL